MEFTKLDFTIIVSMSLILIAINFTFPALGLAETSTNASDIPEFNVTRGTYDFVQIGRNFPSRPQKGTLRYVDNQEVHQDNRRIWLEGNSDSGYEVTLTNNGTLSNPIASLFLNEYESGSFSDANSTEMTDGENFTTLENDGYIVAFENASFRNEGQADMTMSVEWRIVQTPEGASALGQLPFVGSAITAVAGAVNFVGAMFAWSADIMFDVVYNFITASSNAANITYNVITYFLDVAYWFMSTYTSVVSSAPTSWIQLILTIPVLLLSLEFVKLTIITKELIPIL